MLPTQGLRRLLVVMLALEVGLILHGGIVEEYYLNTG
jgi:hypothetical protein